MTVLKPLQHLFIIKVFLELFHLLDRLGSTWVYMLSRSSSSFGSRLGLEAVLDMLSLLSFLGQPSRCSQALLEFKVFEVF